MFSHTAILQIRYRTICKISIPLSTIYNCWPHKTITCVPYIMALVREESILQVTFVHVLSIYHKELSKPVAIV